MTTNVERKASWTLSEESFRSLCSLFAASGIPITSTITKIGMDWVLTHTSEGVIYSSPRVCFFVAANILDVYLLYGSYELMRYEFMNAGIELILLRD